MKKNKMKKLIEKLNNASYAYYANDNPIMSDKQYDDLYDELLQLENETGIIFSNSPIQKVQGVVVDYLKEVKHTKPMLSANKTKDIDEIKKFIHKNPTVMSWKEDGLTVVLRYKNGIFKQAITRGGGTSGEDVTHTMKMCRNIPLKLPYCADLEVRGECVISWKEFERINLELDKPYMHPRNLAAGTLRQLNSNILYDREITFKAFELVQDKLNNNDELIDHILNISDSFEYLAECGFDVVEHEFVTEDNIESLIEKYKPENYEYPVDGLIFKYDDYLYGKKLGETAKYPLNMIALKWKDELYKTKLIDIEWFPSKTGLINPVAVFEPTDLDGAITTRATLHNVTYIENLQLGIGDEIQIYRANMVIPKIHENLTRSNTYTIPTKCPVCGEKTETKKENNSKVLICTNPNCKGKLLGRVSHFVSKKGMDIDGLSEETIKKFIELGWINNIYDVYRLDEYFERLKSFSGFGKKSVEKLKESIEASKITTLKQFISALSIPNVGTTQAKILAKQFNTWDKFYEAATGSYNFSKLEGFGDVMNKNIHKWFTEDNGNVKQIISLLAFKENASNTTSTDLTGKTFVITGSVHIFKNRDEFKSFVESANGKVSGSVSKNTYALVNNDKESSSSKNKKAKELNIPIVTEEEFMEMVKNDL